MIQDIQIVQTELESRFMADQPEIDSAAQDLFERSPRLAKDYLTDYSVAAGGEDVNRWRELGKFLLYKYLDGNVKDEHGKVTHPGYPESWYERVAAATGEHLQMVKLESEKKAEAEKKEKAQEMGRSVLTLLDAREIEIDADARARVEESEDLAQLREWLVQAATAESADGMFDEE